MNLARQQQAFAGALWASDDTTPPGALGMQIYRNAYRARLLNALEVSYEHTRRWVGEEAFAAAACHYVISHPPHDWTLDRFGAQFPAVLAELFANDGEVAELAWLEWHLQQAFAAPDLPELSGLQLAQANLRDDDWDQLCLTMSAGYAALQVGHDCTGLWQALRDDELAGFSLTSTDPGVLVVWRQALTPRFRVLTSDEFTALEALVQGQSFGRVATMVGEERAAQLGGWFAQWLSEGLFAGFKVTRTKARNSPTFPTPR